MPEGDTIAKLAAFLRPRLEGRSLVGGAVRGAPRLVLAGERVVAVETHGKHLFVTLAGDGEPLVLRTHLGMRGTWHRYAPGEAWKLPRAHASLWLETAQAVFVCFYAEEVEVGDAGIAATQRRRRLGPDLVREELEPAELVRRARALLAPDTPACDVLLDQRVAAGVGNVYKSEVLFLEGVAPSMLLERMDDATLGRLYRTAQILLRANLGDGPRVTRLEGGGGGNLWVYRRAGSSCRRCGTPIELSRLGRGRRGTYWCPRCQGNRS